MKYFELKQNYLMKYLNLILNYLEIMKKNYLVEFEFPMENLFVELNAFHLIMTLMYHDFLHMMMFEK